LLVQDLKLHVFNTGKDASPGPVRTTWRVPQRLCNRSELRTGKWVNAVWERPPYVPSESKCRINETFGESPWSTYEWIPEASQGEDGCEFAQFEPEQFCEFARNKNITFVGDSLVYENMASLVHWLGGKIWTRSLWGVNRNEKPWFSQHVCNGSAHINFKSTRRFDSSLHDVTAISDILYLNRGAYFSPDDEMIEGMHRTILQLEEWQADCRIQGRDCHLIWRTTVPGHPKCWQWTEPATNIAEMEDLIGMTGNYSSHSNAMRTFHWDDCSRQNKLVLAEFANSTLDYDVMDAYEIGILRRDQHVGLDGGGVDCLHNCEPGKLIVYNQLLLHFMKRRFLRANK
jgi:hypothetical protein